MNADIALHIVWRADIGAVNAFARSCKLIAAVVSARKHDLADRLTVRSVKDGVVTYCLPNGRHHGPSYSEGDTENKLMIQWEFGLAMSWMLHGKTGSTYGHRMTRHLLYGGIAEHRQHLTIEVGGTGDDFDVNINVIDGCVDITRWAPDGRQKVGISNLSYTNPPPWRLTGYLVDDVLAPGAINAWVDAVLDASGCGIKVEHGTPRVPSYVWYLGGMLKLANASDLVHGAC